MQRKHLITVLLQEWKNQWNRRRLLINILADLHCHTVASTHAYSTIKEYAEVAAQKGMQGIAITDHAPGVTDGAHLYHFQNLSVVPRKLYGVTILRGAECTIQSDRGYLDLDNNELSRLDIVIASMHQSQYAPKNSKEHTKTLLNLMDNPAIDILGHIGREKTEFDVDSVVKKAKETGKLIEINSSSIIYGNIIKERCVETAKLCKKYSLPIVVNSDSHICYNVGNVDLSLQLLQEIGYDEDLIMNTTLDKIVDYLNITI